MINEVVLSIVQQSKFFNKLFRNQVQDVYDGLKNLFLVEKYHSGIDDIEKYNSLKNWQANNIDIMVATSAFGMGNVISFAQESGN